MHTCGGNDQIILSFIFAVYHIFCQKTLQGMEGFKGAKRGTNYAGQMAATAAAKACSVFKL